MFRALRVKPTNGWNSVAWELTIVTLGVLIALAVQQWADGRSTGGKVEASKATLRAELEEHYNNAIEYRVVYPCLQAQIGRLRDRVIASGPINDPAPIFSDTDLKFVLRIPSKTYPSDAWQAAVSDGLIRQFDVTLRRLLAAHHEQMVTVRRMSDLNDDAVMGLGALGLPLPLDPTVRYSIVKDIEQLRGRLEFLDLLHGQIIDTLHEMKMRPPLDEARAFTKRYGSYNFCRTQRLSMRSFEDAMRPVAN